MNYNGLHPVEGLLYLRVLLFLLIAATRVVITIFGLDDGKSKDSRGVQNSFQSDHWLVGLKYGTPFGNWYQVPHMCWWPGVLVEDSGQRMIERLTIIVRPFSSVAERPNKGLFDAWWTRISVFNIINICTRSSPLFYICNKCINASSKL